MSIESLVIQANRDILANFFESKGNVPLEDSEIEHVLKLMNEIKEAGNKATEPKIKKIKPAGGFQKVIEAVAKNREARTRSRLIAPLKPIQNEQMDSFNVTMTTLNDSVIVEKSPAKPARSKTAQVILQSLKSNKEPNTEHKQVDHMKPPSPVKQVEASLNPITDVKEPIQQIKSQAFEFPNLFQVQPQPLKQEPLEQKPFKFSMSTPDQESKPETFANFSVTSNPPPIAVASDKTALEVPKSTGLNIFEMMAKQGQTTRDQPKKAIKTIEILSDDEEELKPKISVPVAVKEIKKSEISNSVKDKESESASFNFPIIKQAVQSEERSALSANVSDSEKIFSFDFVDKDPTEFHLDPSLVLPTFEFK